MITIHQRHRETDRQTDRQTDDMRLQFRAICNHSAAICDRISPSLKSIRGWVTLGPNLGVFHVEQTRHVGVAKSEHPRLTNGEIISEEFQSMWSQFTNVTERRTDRQTDRQTDDMRLQFRALHESALRGKNRSEDTLWRPLLPYGYSHKASCAGPG